MRVGARQAVASAVVLGLHDVRNNLQWSLSLTQEAAVERSSASLRHLVGGKRQPRLGVARRAFSVFLVGWLGIDLPHTNREHATMLVAIPDLIRQERHVLGHFLQKHLSV